MCLFLYRRPSLYGGGFYIFYPDEFAGGRLTLPLRHQCRGLRGGLLVGPCALRHYDLFLGTPWPGAGGRLDALLPQVAERAGVPKRGGRDHIAHCAVVVAHLVVKRCAVKLRLHVGRVQFYGPPKGVQGVLIPSGADVGQGHIEVRGRVPGVNFDSPGKVLKRKVVLLQAHVHPAAVKVTVLNVRPQFNYLCKVPDRLVVVSQLPVGQAAFVVSNVVVRVALKQPVVVADRVPELLKILLCLLKAAYGALVLGVQVERSAKVALRLPKLLHQPSGHTPVVIRYLVARAQYD